MLDRIRSDFRNEDRETMLVLGLSMTVVGTLTASGVSDVGISVVLGIAIAVSGLFVLVGTIFWGSEKQSQSDT